MKPVGLLINQSVRRSSPELEVGFSISKHAFHSRWSRRIVERAFESYIDYVVSEDMCFYLVRYLKPKRIRCCPGYEYISESRGGELYANGVSQTDTINQSR